MKNKKNGFTLIEFLLIVIVLGILIGLGWYIKNYHSSAKVKLAKSFNVVLYGADPSGKKDSSIAIQNAINAAGATELKTGVRQIVYFPKGIYILDNTNNLKINGVATPDLIINYPNISIEGAGQNSTKIIEEIGNAKTVNGKPGQYPELKRGRNIFVFTKKANYGFFSGLTVDSRTYNAGTGLVDNANHTTIQNATFLGANNGNGGAGTSINPAIDNVYNVQLATVCNPNPLKSNYVGKVFRGDNTVNNLTLIGGGAGGNDDLDLSCQVNDKVSNITDTGWGIGIYLDKNMTITNVNYTPSINKLPHFGWYITDGQNITINNFTTSGPGGRISSPNHPSDNITINNERMTAAKGFSLDIVDGSNITINNSKLDKLYLAPSSKGSAGINGLKVNHTTILSTTCNKSSGLSISGLSGVSC